MAARTLGALAGCLLVVASAPAQQTGAPSSFDSNGVTIRYADDGQGEPVVLLHGFTGSYERHWEAPGAIDTLKKAGYRVIAIDCRGHGGSGKPRNPSDYGLEMVGDVIRLLDHLRIQRAHVVGYSMGGAIANQILVRYPHRLSTVTLVGAGWEGEDLKALNSQMMSMADGFTRRDATALITGVTTSGQNSPTAEQVAAANVALFARNEPEVLAAVARGMMPLFEISADSLRATTTPVLAVFGEHDTWNVPSVKRMAGIVPTMEVVQIPGAGHAPIVGAAIGHIVMFLGDHKRN